MAEVKHIFLSKSASEEAPAAPDSTTSMFVEGEDVLVDRNHTGQFFMGTIVQIDRATEKCLLRFLDNKECWAHLNELQRVKDDPEDILCVLCKKIDQTVSRCPKCGRGYHRSCLEPSIPNGFPAAKWQCLRCGSKNLKKKRSRLSINSAEGHVKLPSPVSFSSDHQNASPQSAVLGPSTSKVLPLSPVKKTPVSSFPYVLSSLIWDEYHRVNESANYCYCGQPGDWYLQMLQCAYCRQWFHQDCLSCLHFPLYCGDQLYLFLCSVCNDDEFLRRFDFGWVDIVHLTIFNLIIFKKKKYFDVDSEIIPYVKNNWFFMQIPAQLVKCSDSELRRIILKMLEDNSTKSCRFKSGREINTKKRIWGLRIRVPPKRIPFSLPPVRPLTDDAVKSWWKKCHITFQEPLPNKYLMQKDAVLHPNGCMSTFDYSLMLGCAPKTSMVHTRNLREAAVGIHLLDPSILYNKFAVTGTVNGGQSFTGYAKKTSAYSACNRFALQESLRNSRSAGRKRLSLRSKASVKKEASSIQNDFVLANSSQDGYESVDSQTSCSQDDTYVSSNAVSEESLDENDISQDGYDSSGEESDIGTEESTSISVLDDCQSADSHDNLKLTSTCNAKESTNITERMELLSKIDIDVKDELGADGVVQEPSEALSNCPSLADAPHLSGALDTPQSAASPATDSVFPSVSSTPADTEAEEDSIGAQETQLSSLPSIADLIGSPIIIQKEQPTVPLIPSLPRLTPVIKEPPLARAVKRKLSEKDIKIVNGQVKQRRRIRRIQSNQALRTKTVHLDSGEKLEKRIVGGKLLRSPHKPPVIDTVPETNLPIGEASSSSSSSSPLVRPEETVSDVKKNVQSIFSARNRIASGEKFKIKGRRVTADGVEYLIEWEYPM